MRCIFGMKLFLPLSASQSLPSCAGVERRLRAFAPRNRDGVRGRPRFGPSAIPLRRAWLASGRLCRRPSGGRMFEAAVLHLLRADNSAGLAGHVKRQPRSPGADGIHGVRLRVVNLHSARSSALSGRRGSGDIRFMVRGERPKADHVGFLIKSVLRFRAWPYFGAVFEDPLNSMRLNARKDQSPECWKTTRPTIGNRLRTRTNRDPEPLLTIKEHGKTITCLRGAPIAVVARCAFNGRNSASLGHADGEA